MKIQEKIKSLVKTLKTTNYRKIFKDLIFFLKFFLLVIIYLINSSINWIIRVFQKISFLRKPIEPIRDFVKKIYEFATSKCSCNKYLEGDITSLDLIILAIRHLKSKKNRTIITIGGMAIGFGSVIFLLSLGYGVQNLVVSRVARLGEMKQVDVSVGQATSLSLDDDAISSFLEINNVKSVLPLVSVVSKVTYNNSVSDIVAYGVTREFLEESAIKPSKGGLFEDGEIISYLPSLGDNGVVAGVQIELIPGAKMNKKFSDITYSLHPLIWKKVRSEPSLDSNVIGYTRRSVGNQQAIEVWGNDYSSTLDLPKGSDFFNNEYSVWIKDDFPIWKKESCSKEAYDCYEGSYVLQKDGGLQQIRSGFLTEENTTLSRYDIVYDSLPTLEEGEVFEKIQFSFLNNKKTPVYSSGDTSSKMLMLFSGQDKEDILYSGELVFGGSYYDVNNWGSAGVNKNDQKVGYWIRAKLPLWRQLDCKDCETLFTMEVDSYDNQVKAYSFIPANVVDIENLSEPVLFGQVLGDSTASAQLLNDFAITSVQKEDGTLEWVSIASGSATTQTDQMNEVAFVESSKREVLVNRAMLSMLGIDESNAVGKVFTASLMLDSDFFKDNSYQAKSRLTKLNIVGVIPEEKTPAFYLPFSDIKNLGVENYSQLKVVVEDKKDLKEVRKEIEAMGYRTASVVDTVGRINDLFGTIRLLLSILGLIALSVAALGMFNTLTVSLMEKTREVGLMKAMGMKSDEVKRLFLAESIIIGLLGGIFGLIFGVIAGYVLSFFLSTISIMQGSGFINLVSVPILLSVGIITLSFFVGIGTGLYPAHRATKISALNALRYE